VLASILYIYIGRPTKEDGRCPLLQDIESKRGEADKKLKNN